MASDDERAVRYAVSSSVAAGGSAIAVVDVFEARDDATGRVGDVIERLTGRGAPRVGAIALRDIGGVDRGLVVLRSDTHAMVFVHGGAAVLTGVRDALDRAGAAEEDGTGDAGALDPRAAYPEAASLFDACLMDVLARAESALGVELLLKQRARWRRAGRAFDTSSAEAQRHAEALAPLVRAPVVVAVGPANVGKSTLTNALAKQQVSLVADVAGTTRDHVGVTLNLGGLTVRWIDAPGVRRAGARDGGVLSDVDRTASALLRPIAASAALVVSCGDSASGFLGDAELRELGVERGQALLRCGTRVDRDDDMPDRKRVTADVRTAALRREGLEALASAVRRAIVPGWAIEDERPWVFHPALSGPTAAGSSTVCRG